MSNRSFRFFSRLLNLSSRVQQHPQTKARLFSIGLTSTLLAGCIGVYGQSSEVAGGFGDTGENWAVEGSSLIETDGYYFTDEYRNVFLEMGKSQDEIDARLAQIYEVYFSLTDPDALYYELNPKEGYVLDVAHDDVRSEGQSYAMMIALQYGERATFDKLWNFAITRMRINDPKHPNYRGYAWAVNRKGEICDENSAPDGEEYFAMALYFAHHRWGSSPGKGVRSYKYWADEILDMMKNRPPISGSRSRLEVDGDGAACVGRKITDQVTSVPLFDSTQKQIRFNATQGSDFTDPSYHLAAFYELFGLWGPEADASFWKSAAATSRSFLGRAMHKETGLAPEYSSYAGSPHRVPWNNLSGQFAYDAWRVGGNVGMDWAWMAQPGSEIRARADALISFLHQHGPTQYLGLYQVDGSGATGHHSPGLIAMTAVATLAATDKVKDEARDMVEEFWNTELPRGKYRYYDGLLYGFASLHLSGRYVIHLPDAEKSARAARKKEAEARSPSETEGTQVVVPSGDEPGTPASAVETPAEDAQAAPAP